jgi:hypothetical protein
MEISFPQGLKPNLTYGYFAARLKPCPFKTEVSPADYSTAGNFFFFIQEIANQRLRPFRSLRWFLLVVSYSALL